MFRGNNPTRVDEKGRLKVPADFKRVIDEKYGQKFYITSMDGKVAQMYPFEEWEQIEAKLAALSNFNPSKKRFLTVTNYYGQVVEMDGQGRLLLPQLLRESAQLKGDVAVMGYLNHLEVRGLEAVKAEVEQGFTADDEKGFERPMNDLGILGPEGRCDGKEVQSHTGSFKTSDRFLSRPARRDIYRCHVGTGWSQLRNRTANRPRGTLIGFDKDPAALERARKRLSEPPAELGGDWPRIRYEHGIVCSDWRSAGGRVRQMG